MIDTGGLDAANLAESTDQGNHQGVSKPQWGRGPQAIESGQRKKIKILEKHYGTAPRLTKHWMMADGSVAAHAHMQIPWSLLQAGRYSGLPFHNQRCICHNVTMNMMDCIGPEGS